MNKVKSFLGLTLLGGLMVVLPIAILMMLFQWLFAIVTDFIQPLSDMISSRADVRSLFAQILVLLLLFGMCFSIGLLVKTGLGRWLHYWLDMGLEKFAPGYATIRDLVVQLMGGSKDSSLFRGQVALVRLYGDCSELWVTGIVTARFENMITVFVPTAPVPTSGMIYHLTSDNVQLLPDVSVEQAMKTIVACGVGSQGILQSAHTINVER